MVRLELEGPGEALHGQPHPDRLALGGLRELLVRDGYGSWNEVRRSRAEPDYDMLKFRITVKNNLFAVHVGDWLLPSFFSDQYPQGKVGLQIAQDTLIDNFVIKETTIKFLAVILLAEGEPMKFF
jgi:hypothetical protein